MLKEVLASWTPGPLEILIILFLGMILFVVPVVMIICVFRYFTKGRDELKNLKVEMEKLKEELANYKKD
jgi:hypothetical protein